MVMGEKRIGTLGQLREKSTEKERHRRPMPSSASISTARARARARPRPGASISRTSRPGAARSGAPRTRAARRRRWRPPRPPHEAVEVSAAAERARGDRGGPAPPPVRRSKGHAPSCRPPAAAVDATARTFPFREAKASWRRRFFVRMWWSSFVRGPSWSLCLLGLFILLGLILISSGLMILSGFGNPL